VKLFIETVSEKSIINCAAGKFFINTRTAVMLLLYRK
jgi:hypothetical protein